MSKQPEDPRDVAEWLGETAPGADSASAFDAAICDYAKATWHHDSKGMRAGYIRLRALSAPEDPADTIARLNALVLQREAEIDGLRKDAERYRWLRNESAPYKTHIVSRGGWSVFTSDADAAIDAAMAGSGCGDSGG